MTKKQTVVLSVGGSMVIPHEIDVDFLREFKRVMEAFVKKGNRQAVLVIGGGAVSRQYQAAARKLVNASHEDQDWIGIMSTRLNAELVRVLFGDMAHPQVRYDRKKVYSKKRVIVGSGYKPGQSSDREAVKMALVYGARRVMNISNVKYVYNKDPKKFRDARPILRMTWEEYLKMFDRPWQPGMNVPFDPVAARDAHKEGLEVVILSGDQLHHLENCLNGKPFEGTIIGPSHDELR